MCLVMLYFTLVLACVAGFLGFRGGERRGNWGREGRNRVKNVVLSLNFLFLILNGILNVLRNKSRGVFLHTSKIFFLRIGNKQLLQCFEPLVLDLG